MRRDGIGQTLGSIHQQRIDGAGDAGGEPALVHRSECHGRADEGERPILADADAFKPGGDQHARKIPAEGELLRYRHEHNGAKCAQAQPDDEGP